MAEVLEEYVGRLAPSPTGALHLGNVRTFAIAWLRARSQGGKVIMRMEDLDHPKDKPGAAANAIADLKWLGFDWDEEYVQSTRKDHYREALNRIRSQIYPCTCSRKDVMAAQSAPHSGEQLFYPGTCRGRYADFPTGACWRFMVEAGTRIEFEDMFAGKFSQQVDAVLGDFPISRDEGGAGYTLACVVDDHEMGVTEVVRGDDLLGATPAQIVLYRALGWEPPRFCHVPLVVGGDGHRLAKRHGDTRVSAFREQGIAASTIIGWVAASCGWVKPGEKVALEELLPRFTLSSISHSAVIYEGI